MSDIEQAYRVLGLESDASFKEVMEAHRDLAVVWDPRPHENNPRLHRKATENLARVNQAFQLIRRHHLGAQIEPEEDLEEAFEPAGAESEEPESSLYEEIFSDREAEAQRRMPIGKIVVAVLALMIGLTYWSSLEEDQNSDAAQQAPRGTEDLLEVEIKDGSLEIPSREPSAAEPAGEPTVASEPLIVRKSASSPPVPPPPVDVPEREAPVVEQNTPEPENRPVLQRQTSAPDLDVESPTAAERQEEERSKEAFQMLRDKSIVAQRLIEGELQDDLHYQEWKMVRAREPEFWIDLIAQRSGDQGELHLIWSVNAETGVVIPMSQAARDLDAELSR